MRTVLLDTNVILRLIDRQAAAHTACQRTIESLLAAGDEPCLVPQVLIELWVVATRPIDANGLGWTPVETRTEIDQLRGLFRLLPDTPGIFDEWLTLVEAGISGKRAHDARLAACARAHKLDAILTLNPADFAGFGIEVLKPR